VAEDNAMAIDVHPGLHPIVPGHDVRCWLYHDVNGRLLPRPEGWVPRTDVAAEVVLATGTAADSGAAAGPGTGAPDAALSTAAEEAAARNRERGQ
jgi:hypothetical protein